MYTRPATLPPPKHQPKHPGRKRLFVILYVAAALVLVALGVFFGDKALAPDAAPATTTGKIVANTSHAFNKQRFSTSDPASIWVVVNKQHQLDPKDYTPTDLVVPHVPLRVPGNESMQLRQEAAIALQQLVASANGDGVSLMLASGYRSYAYQVGLYNGYVKSMGAAEADKTSARPGHSEHQTGLALDLEPTNKACELEQCFGSLPEGKWLAAHAYEYGFIIRYTKDKVAVTGYEYEPWHLRYVGKDLAAELHTKGIATLEEFFDITGGTSY